jgi:hypothetical protein
MLLASARTGTHRTEKLKGENNAQPTSHIEGASRMPCGAVIIPTRRSAGYRSRGQGNNDNRRHPRDRDTRTPKAGDAAQTYIELRPATEKRRKTEQKPPGAPPRPPSTRKKTAVRQKQRTGRYTRTTAKVHQRTAHLPASAPRRTTPIRHECCALTPHTIPIPPAKLTDRRSARPTNEISLGPRTHPRTSGLRLRLLYTAPPSPAFRTARYQRTGARRRPTSQQQRTDSQEPTR